MGQGWEMMIWGQTAGRGDSDGDRGQMWEQGWKVGQGTEMGTG